MSKVKISRINIALMVIGIIVAIVLGIKVIQQQGFSFTVKEFVPTRMKGNPQAQTKIVEFVDFQCPACAHGAAILIEFMEKNPDKISLEMKYFPLTGHSHGLLSAKYAECAAIQGQFWPMHDLLFGRQHQWKDLVDARPSFDLMGKELGLNMYQLHSCIKDDRVEAYITDHRMEGKELGVRSTPSYLFNGKNLVVGTKSLQEELDKLIK